MVQNVIDIGINEDRIINIVKAKYGFKNKSDAVSYIVKIYTESFLEPQLRPEYLKKLKKIQNEGYGKTFNSVEQLRKEIEKS